MTVSPYRINAGFFSNNQDIHPDPTIIQKMYGAFAVFNMFPGNISEVEPIRGQLVNRLKFNTLDNSFNVIFGLNRLDFQVGVSPSGTGLNLSEQIELFQKILLAVETTHPRMANRLSLVCNFMFDSVPASEMDAYFKDTFKPIDVAPESTNRDWSYRATYSKELEFAGKLEKVNYLFHLQRVQGIEIKPGNIQESFDKLELQIDINTVPEDITPRFKPIDANSFYQEASSGVSIFGEIILDIFNLK